MMMVRLVRGGISYSLVLSVCVSTKRFPPHRLLLQYQQHTE